MVVISLYNRYQYYNGDLSLIHLSNNSQANNFSSAILTVVCSDRTRKIQFDYVHHQFYRIDELLLLLLDEIN